MPTSTGPETSSNATIEEILRRRFPGKLALESLLELSVVLGGPAQSMPEPFATIYQTERERLRRLSPAELAKVRHALDEQARRQAISDRAARHAKEEAKAVATEAAKAYNQPVANAEFDFWFKADFWTLHESLTLLLGKDPRAVTWTMITQDMEASVRAGQDLRPDSILHRYQQLLTLALRSDVMTAGAKLRPMDVVRWAHRVGLVELPEPLQRLALAAREPVDEIDRPDGDSAASPISETTGTMIKRSALVERYRRAWPTIESDLRHANENGLGKAAKVPGRRGQWYEEAAVQWAKQNRTFLEASLAFATTLDRLPGRQHRIGD